MGASPDPIRNARRSRRRGALATIGSRPARGCFPTLPLGFTMPPREDHRMAKWHYTKGAHDLGNGCFAYLQPDGTWGWSNAGLVTDGGETLLVDTLFDLRL